MYNFALTVKYVGCISSLSDLRIPFLNIYIKSQRIKIYDCAHNIENQLQQSTPNAQGSSCGTESPYYPVKILVCLEKIEPVQQN